MPEARKMKRVDLDNPEQMAKALRSGVVWQVTAFWQKAIDAINSGLVPVDECPNIPPEARAALKESK